MDFNGDGRDDLLAAARLTTVGGPPYSRRAALLASTATGGATAAQYLSLEPGTPVGDVVKGVGVGDLNLDGVADLVTAFDNQLVVSPGTGSGFGAAAGTTTTLPVSTLAVAQLDSDARAEVIVAPTNAPTVRMFEYQSGSLTEAGAALVFDSNYVSALVAADFDADGTRDVAALSTLENQVATTSWNGTAFSTVRRSPLSRAPLSIAAADFDGDGKQDLVFAANGTKTVGTTPGFGDGTFGVQQGFALVNAIAGVDVADFNRDGVLDLAVANGTYVRALANPGRASLTQTAQFGGAWSLVAIRAADVNRDAKMDMVAADSVTDSIYVFLGAGDGTFTQSSAGSFVTTAGEKTELQLRDFDRNGKLDVLAIGTTSAALYVGDGAGGFSAGLALAFGGALASQVRDMNLDGKLDVVRLHDSPRELRTYLGDSAGGFTLTETSSVASATAFQSEDLDRSGTLDFAVAVGSDLVFYDRGMGGALTERQRISNVGAIHRIASADLDRDLAPDLITSNSATGAIRVIVRNTSGVLAIAEQYSLPGVTTIVPADLDRDGHVDFALASDGPPRQVGVLRGF